MTTYPYPWEVENFLSFFFEMIRDGVLPLLAWGIVFGAMLLFAMVLGTAIYLISKSALRRWRS